MRFLRNSETIQRKISGRHLAFPHDRLVFHSHQIFSRTHNFSLFHSFPVLSSMFKPSMWNKKVKQKSPTHTWSSVSKIYDATTHGRDIQIMYFDFLKAFDNVASEILADRMEKVYEGLFETQVEGALTRPELIWRQVLASQAALSHGLIFLQAPSSVFCCRQAGFFSASRTFWVLSPTRPCAEAIVSAWKLLCFFLPLVGPTHPSPTHAFLSN